jgi:hypothetical protein
MLHVKNYSEFNRINESKSNAEQALCEMVFKDIVDHLAGRDYVIKTDYAEFSVVDADIESEAAENDGVFTDSDMELEIRTTEGETLPREMVDLLIETGIYDGDFAEMMSNADEEDMVLFDMMDLKSPGFEIAIMGIDVEAIYNHYDLAGTYDAPPESETEFEESTITLNSPFIINISNGDHSIEISVQPGTGVLQSYCDLFEKAAKHYGAPGNTSFFLNSKWQGSDTAREKVRFRSKNP